jgi:uncharacterized protein (TIGR00369 family)
MGHFRIGRRKQMSEIKLNPRYAEAVAIAVNRSPYFSLLSMEIKDLQWGVSVLEVQLEQKHLQPFGFVHGGALASIVDAATFWAVFPQVENGLGLTTVDLKVNFLAPAQKGKLVARGRCIRLGKTLALADAEIRNNRNGLVVHGTSTMMVVPDLRITGDENFPPARLK